MLLSASGLVVQRTELIRNALNSSERRVGFLPYSEIINHFVLRRKLTHDKVQLVYHVEIATHTLDALAAVAELFDILNC